MFEIRYEGLREVAQALRVINRDLYDTLVIGLKQAGEIIQKDARARFIEYGGDRGAGRAASFVKAAEGFQTLVRPNTSTMALVSVGQTLRSSSDMLRRRRNFGDLMMRKALLPARDASMDAAYAVVDKEVQSLLTRHGF